MLFKIMILLVISTFTFKHLRGYEEGSLQRRTDALPTESVEARIDMAASMGYKVTSTRCESNYLARETRNHLHRRFVDRNNAKYQTHPRETYVIASINESRLSRIFVYLEWREVSVVSASRLVLRPQTTPPDCTPSLVVLLVAECCFLQRSIRYSRKSSSSPSETKVVVSFKLLFSFFTNLKSYILSKIWHIIFNVFKIFCKRNFTYM